VSVKVVETEHYRRKVARLLSESERADLCVYLAENPEAHDVAPGLGGLRKARWGQKSRGKGKRGGVRIIYFFALSAQLIALFDIYSNDEKEDLTNDDKKRLRQRLEKIKGGLT
jgi:mRNA-degrading endonuclease RelE of RelBE toxin-antitoxin system